MYKQSDTASEIPASNDTARLLTLDAVCRMTSRSRSSIYRDIERDLFPAPVRTGPKSNAWVLAEVQEWIRRLPRRKSPSGS